MITKTKYIFYCDMDGVLTDFPKSAKLLRDDIFELPEKTLWKTISDAGSDFWKNMKWMQGGKDLWTFIEKFNPHLLTALPGISVNDPIKEYSRIGKTKWVERELGKKFVKRIIFTTSKKKYKYATPLSILIDDRDDIIKAWIKEGGIGIQHVSAEGTIFKLNKILSE